ncbi:M20/M25/M40 family metallo-hydrolase [Paenibacillus sp. MZ04-78.2]|uniref:M20 family metallopeptidase n=1 Tax=Paenibacillus sp. MZ04-78.2 TaxID=2962034 RepID=UPI0020B78E73|nr:M20/M25/M40 family metallo-hydrolase [Paenibacillus sp. MZ04-78.2]MCP3772768.1 M20/M25/M40 family metallo-hydrolase [Paenibacillus sp. MZ04-78.2]
MREGLIPLVSELIQMKSTSPEAINKSAEYCANWLQNQGLRVQILENQGLKSVVAEAGGGQSEETIILNGHLDVVPGEESIFIPRIEGGKLFGRGSYDMLGAVAAMMTATAEMAKRPNGCKVVLQLVPDEETGGKHGTGFLVEQGARGDFVICGEPTNLHVAVQAKGVLQLLVEVDGIAAHGSRPWLGKNAITRAFELYQQIQTLDFLQESSRFFPRPSLNLAKVEGGKAINQVPDRCAFYLDIRYLPNQDPEKILTDIRHSVSEAKVTVIQQGSPVQTDENSRHVRLLQQTTGECTGTKVNLFGQDGSADTRYYAKYAIPAVEFGPIGANHHGPDEYVDIESLHVYQQILQKFITNLTRG